MTQKIIIIPDTPEIISYARAVARVFKKTGYVPYIDNLSEPIETKHKKYSTLGDFEIIVLTQHEADECYYLWETKEDLLRESHIPPVIPPV
jgi:hypothetical protein